MKDFYIIARPNTASFMQHKYPHQSDIEYIDIADSLAGAMASTLRQSSSRADRIFERLTPPQIQVLYHVEADESVVSTGRAVGAVLKHLCTIKSVEAFLSADAIHPAYALKGENADEVCEKTADVLWDRVAMLREHNHIYQTYTKIPPEALKIWLQSIAAAEVGQEGQIPLSNVSLFAMYYETAPEPADIKHAAHYAIAKTAMNQRLSTRDAKNLAVLNALEDNAMKAFKDVAALYGRPTDKQCGYSILQHTLPILSKIAPQDRSAFVRGVQATAQRFPTLSNEDILMEAYQGFKQNHPQYQKSLDSVVTEAMLTIHSPVPMLVYGFWEGLMEQQCDAAIHNAQINQRVQDAFKKGLTNSEESSEIRRIAEAIAAAQNELVMHELSLEGLPSGMDVAQVFTANHLARGLDATVCYAWVPDDIRPNIEEIFQEQCHYRDKTLAMVYALASAMAKTELIDGAEQTMREISTVLNEVSIQGYNAGIEPVDISNVMNNAFWHESGNVELDEH